eukprot:758817-Hanusia_phi.AAC.2
MRMGGRGGRCVDHRETRSEGWGGTRYGVGVMNTGGSHANGCCDYTKDRVGTKIEGLMLYEFPTP